MLILYRFFKFVFRYLVPPSLRYPFVRGIGRLVCRLNKGRREVIVGNLTPLVGKEKAMMMAPELLGNFLMTAVDFFCIRADLPKTTPVENWGHLDKAYRKTKRVIAVTAHLGHWELGLPCLVEKGYTISGLYAPYREDNIVRWIMGHRNSDVQWIPSTRGAAEACIDALEKGRILGIVADIPFGERGRKTVIAGHTARLPLGPWAIAVRAQATVVPAFIIREKPGHYRAIIHEPIAPMEGSFRRQMEQMQDVFRGHLERYLLSYPTQWGVLQAFWDSASSPQGIPAELEEASPRQRSASANASG